MYFKPFFSIIVPLYNAEQYIEECLQSCVKQSFANIEILVVDDCGKDNSVNIVQRYVKEDSRILLIHHQVNLGVFCARNTGVDYAQGKYVLFLDSDDFLDIHCCEMLYKELSQMEVDIFHFISGNYPRDETQLIAGSRDLLHNNEVLKNIFLRKSELYSLWGKAIKLDLLKESIETLKFIDMKIICSEDLLLLFVLASLAQSSKGVNNNSIYYFYRNTENSVTRNYSHEMIKKRIYANNQVISYLNVLDNTNLVNNKYYFLAKKDVINLLKYYNAFQSRMLVGNVGIFSNYLYSIILSLFYKFRFKNLIRLFIYILSLGKIKW